MSTERPNWIDQEITKNKKRDELFRKFVHELKTEDRYQNYLKQFSDHSVESFIKDYAYSKTNWYDRAEDNLFSIQYNKDKWLKYGIECIGYILCKKLFDIHCAWRSEKIKIEGVNFAYLFDIWESDIFSCPFIEPVTQEDIDLFIRFLHKCPIELSYLGYCEGQDYEDIKAYYVDGSKSPRIEDCYVNSWYDFHCQETGMDLFLIASSDLRGPKEEFYADLGREEERAKAKQESKPSVSTHNQEETLPDIEFYDEKFLDNFVKRFDTKDSYRRYSEKKTWMKPFLDNKTAEIEEDLGLLYRAKRLVPMDHNEDWRDGVKYAVERYKREMIIDILPLAMKAYKDHLETGVPLPHLDQEDQELFRNNMIKIFENQILRGRELNGEPRDFNF